MLTDPPDDEALGEWFDELLAWDRSQASGSSPPRTVSYGSSPEQVADLWLPLPDDSNDGPPAVLVSLHGGYFAEPFRRDLHEPVIHELVRRGFAVWNVEYRRAGSGRFEETTADVWAAVDALAAALGAAGVPLSGGVAVFGHSAGGYLAEWVASHPAVELVLPLAAASDLAGVVRAGWDDGAVVDWLGAGPDEDPGLYTATSLEARLPAGAKHVLVHGTADGVVGVDQSRQLLRAIEASGDPGVLVELEDEGHFAFLDPREPAFEVLCRHLAAWRKSRQTAARSRPG